MDTGGHDAARMPATRCEEVGMLVGVIQQGCWWV